MLPYFDPVTQTAYPVNFTDIFNVIDNIPMDSLVAWHQQTANNANSSHPNMGVTSFYEVGTDRFDSLFNKITSTASVLDGGSKIVDKSALYHGHGEKIWKNDFGKITLGSNFRIYTPKSGGSLFSDTNSITTNGDTIINRIINKEVGS